jgi:hypothetical protein
MLGKRRQTEEERFNQEKSGIEQMRQQKLDEPLIMT